MLIFDFLETMAADFPVELKLRIDWSEMDLFGHVNNVTFFKYLQAARVNYWEHIGLTMFFDETKTGPILASSSCQFKKPLHYPGGVTILSRVDFIKNSSFGISHRVQNAAGELAAEGTDIIVMYDFNKNEKMNVPGWLRKKIEAVEGRKFDGENS